MPWSGDQLPWTNFAYPKPPRPSGPFEPLNYLTGQPVLIRGGLSGSLSGPPVMTGSSGPPRGSGQPVMLKGGRSGLPSGPPIMLGGKFPSSSNGPPVMLGTGSRPNLYSAPVKLTSSPVMTYGAPSILTGVRIRGSK